MLRDPIPSASRRRPLGAVVLGAATALVVAACAGPPPRPAKARRPLVVVGVDGGEWSVVRALWAEGRLPHLKALAERGTTAELLTRYTASPVIWTTIATGVTPEEHGITDFVVPTPDGDVPVSSTLRRAPALWNMVSRAGGRVAVLGWWASWPAEEVDGRVVSDRLGLGLEREVWPDDGFVERVLAEPEPNPFCGNDRSRERDHAVARLGRSLAGEGYHLLLVYFRGVDIVSHNYWKHYQPEAFADDPPDPDEVRAFADKVPCDYEAVDRAVGELVAAAGPEANVLVISDHGFRPAKREIVKVLLDFDLLLERLGYLERAADGSVDLARSRLYTHASPEFRPLKRVRFGDAVADGERQAVRDRLAADLGRITYGNGEPVFRPREAHGDEDADLVVRVRTRPATPEILLDGDPAPLAGVLAGVSRVSGSHGESTHGIFLAAGPDVLPGADVSGISIHDVAPTVLYALGLPVAENFAGRAFVELFDEGFRRAHPLRTIAAWEGGRKEGDVTLSDEDAALVRELGALGYLD